MKSNGDLVVKCEAHLADLPTWELDDLKRRHVWAMAILPLGFPTFSEDSHPLPVGSSLLIKIVLETGLPLLFLVGHCGGGGHVGGVCSGVFEEELARCAPFVHALVYLIFDLIDLFFSIKIVFFLTIVQS